MNFTLLKRKLRTLSNIIKYKFLENKYSGKLKYLYFPKGSDTLVICFSALPPKTKPLYNFVKSFDDFSVDRVYLGDYWGYRGSYYLYERGKNYPERITSSFIDYIIKKGRYSKVYTAGTSKGGTAALYFGLKHHVDGVFSGACQYYIGSFVNIPVHIKIFKGMMGKNAGKKEEDILNNVMPQMVSTTGGGKIPEIHLIYSKKEHTYPEHIEHLISKLNESQIPFVDIERDFELHGDVGTYFIPYVRDYFSERDLIET